MKAPLVHLQIERDVMHKPTVRVFPHEVPLLQAKFGPDKVFELKDSPKQEREFDPAMQYAILMRKYGSDKGGNPWVQAVYGMEVEGRLEKAMQRGADMLKPKSKGNSDASSKNENAGATQD